MGWEDPGLPVLRAPGGFRPGCRSFISRATCDHRTFALIHGGAERRSEWRSRHRSLTVRLRLMLPVLVEPVYAVVLKPTSRTEERGGEGRSHTQVSVLRPAAESATHLRISVPGDWLGAPLLQGHP